MALPQERLALVDAHARSLVHREAVILGVAALRRQQTNAEAAFSDRCGLVVKLPSEADTTTGKSTA